MKKLFVYGLSIALVAGAASCKKSSKGKMANEWTVSSYEDKSTYSTDGYSSTSTTTGTETSYTRNSSVTSGGTTSTSSTDGTISENTYTINKDGSWSSSKTTVEVDSDTGFTSTTTRTETSEGTWDFLGGVGEFKKNERVVFNVTKSAWTNANVYEITGGNSTTTNTSGSDTYADGENSMVYLIVESKKKELQLSSEGKNTWTSTDASGTDTENSTSSNTMTLVQK